MASKAQIRPTSMEPSLITPGACCYLSRSHNSKLRSSQQYIFFIDITYKFSLVFILKNIWISSDMKSAVYGAETAQTFAVMRWVAHGDDARGDDAQCDPSSFPSPKLLSSPSNASGKFSSRCSLLLTTH